MVNNMNWSDFKSNVDTLVELSGEVEPKYDTWERILTMLVTINEKLDHAQAEVERLGTLVK